MYKMKRQFFYFNNPFNWGYIGIRTEKSKYCICL